MIDSNKIREIIEIPKFKELMSNFPSRKITFTTHTFFRLSDKQKKVLDSETINDYIFESVPILVGIQNNGCYAVFYKYKNQKYIKIILDIRIDKICAVTFYIIDKNQLPMIR